ncbi:MAG: transposase [Xanthomonadales bacterium]|nr:transposase [Xanthomonadales bacterium]
MPQCGDPRCGQGIQARLAHGQGAGKAVHDRTAQACRSARSERAIGIDEISIRKGHTYRIVVSDLIRKRPIWFGGEDRSEASMAMFYAALGPRKTKGIRLAVMDMWKPFRKATQSHAPQAAILFDKFHIMAHLGKALGYGAQD